MIDPFSDEADPARLDVTRSGEPRVGRRPVVLALALVPAAWSLSACAHTQPACGLPRDDRPRCTHRFCRYYRGPLADSAGVPHD